MAILIRIRDHASGQWAQEGHFPPLRGPLSTAAPPPIADIRSAGRHVAEVPIGDILRIGRKREIGSVGDIAQRLLLCLAPGVGFEVRAGGQRSSLAEYADVYGVNRDTVARMKPGGIVMHPGPMNRGIEIEGTLADSEQSVITEQVANGVAVRMAVLERVVRSLGER